LLVPVFCLLTRRKEGKRRGRQVRRFRKKRSDTEVGETLPILLLPLSKLGDRSRRDHF